MCVRRYVVCVAFVFLFFGCTRFLPETEITLSHVAPQELRTTFDFVNNNFMSWYKQEVGKSIRINQSYFSNRYELLAHILTQQIDLVSTLYFLDPATLMYELIDDFQEVPPLNLREMEIPGYMTINFLVHQGNPLNIQDWDDLRRRGIGIVSPDYFYTDIGRLIYLNAWAYSQQQHLSDYQQSINFVRDIVFNTDLEILKSNPDYFILDNIGDVFVTNEHQSHALAKKYSLDIVVPSSSIKANIYMYQTDHNLDRVVLNAYIDFLDNAVVQEFFALQHIHTSDDNILTKLIDVPGDIDNWLDLSLTHFEKQGILLTIRSEKQK